MHTHPLQVLIVEDQQLIREGLVALLSLESDLTILGEAENGQIALDFLAARSPEAQPNVILMDMRMPIMDGVAATQAISQQYPDIKVLVLTTFDDDELIAQSMAVGAKGYLLKDTPSEELAMAIRSVAKGYSQFGPGIIQKMIETLPQHLERKDLERKDLERKVNDSGGSDKFAASPSNSGRSVSSADTPNDEHSEAVAALTPREKEVLAYIGQGASNREIAKALYLSEGTVKNHVTRILSQLGLRDRTQAALLAQAHRSNP